MNAGSRERRAAIRPTRPWYPERRAFAHLAHHAAVRRGAAPVAGAGPATGTPGGGARRPGAGRGALPQPRLRALRRGRPLPGARLLDGGLPHRLRRVAVPPGRLPRRARQPRGLLPPLLPLAVARTRPRAAAHRRAP